MLKNNSQSGKFFLTVKLGQYQTAAVLCDAIEKKGKIISNYAEQIINKISISATDDRVDLLEVSGTELGFTESVPRSEIYKRAFELGFIKCPAEAMALARIQCSDSKWRICGMEPIADSAGDLCMLDLHGDGDDLWLGTGFDRSGGLWFPNDVWVFASPMVQVISSLNHASQCSISHISPYSVW